MENTEKKEKIVMKKSHKALILVLLSLLVVSICWNIHNISKIRHLKHRMKVESTIRGFEKTNPDFNKVINKYDTTYFYKNDSLVGYSITTME